VIMSTQSPSHNAADLIVADRLNTSRLLANSLLEPPMFPELSLLWIQSDQRKHLGMLRCAQSPHLSPRAGMHAAGSPLKSP
jgi:hypothetical protein